jgi:hypothetical protein
MFGISFCEHFERFYNYFQKNNIKLEEKRENFLLSFVLHLLRKSAIFFKKLKLVSWVNHLESNETNKHYFAYFPEVI